MYTHTRKIQDNTSRATANNQKSRFTNTEANSAPIQEKENKTGMSDSLKSGIENLSGIGMDDVKVHYNSTNATSLMAKAYAQGSDIHIAPGQEHHLAHEAWHVVQQKQGRVSPQLSLQNGLKINNDPKLEQEAESRGADAMRMNSGNHASNGSRDNQPQNFSSVHTNAVSTESSSGTGLSSGGGEVAQMAGGFLDWLTPIIKKKPNESRDQKNKREDFDNDVENTYLTGGVGTLGIGATLAAGAIGSAIAGSALPLIGTGILASAAGLGGGALWLNAMRIHNKKAKDANETPDPINPAALGQIPPQTALAPVQPAQPHAISHVSRDTGAPPGFNFAEPVQPHSISHVSRDTGALPGFNFADRDEFDEERMAREGFVDAPERLLND